MQAFDEKGDRLARHLETSTVFSGVSNRIPNDLIEAVADVIINDKKMRKIRRSVQPHLLL